MRSHTSGSRSTLNRHSRYQVVTWMATPPIWRRSPEMLAPVLDDCLRLLSRNHIAYFEASDTRRYLNTQQGVRDLKQTLVTGGLEFLHGISDARLPGQTHLSIVFPSDTINDRSTTIELTVEASNLIEQIQTAKDVAERVREWFVALDAAAYVSVPNGSYFNVSSMTGMIIPPPILWQEVQRYARGVFWGNGLGASLCDQIDTSENIIKNAPVSVTTSLGNGVWLDFDNVMPGDEEISELIQYLRPILGWSYDAFLTRRGRASERMSNTNRNVHVLPSNNTIPVIINQDEHSDIMIINAYYTRNSSRNDVNNIIEAIRLWHQDGARGKFGGEFRMMNTPIVKEHAVRCWVAIRGVDIKRVAYELRDKLLERGLYMVERLIIGQETVG